MRTVTSSKTGILVFYSDIFSNLILNFQTVLTLEEIKVLSYHLVMQLRLLAQTDFA